VGLVWKARATWDVTGMKAHGLWNWNVAQSVERLPSKREALNSTPVLQTKTTKKNMDCGQGHSVSIKCPGFLVTDCI
jgi:hypothetical protein